MILLIDKDQLNNHKSRDLIPLKCEKCNTIFYREKHFIQIALVSTKKKMLKYCSTQCQWKSQVRRVEVKCVQCQKIVFRCPGHIKKHKNRFCSTRCAGIYNSSHRKGMGRRSKLEIYLQKRLFELYPDLKIIYNDRKAILAELDIYIPILKLAFELNGIFHYEQIYLSTLLSDVQRRDKNKIIVCFQQGIELCVIDTTSLKYFKLEKAEQFLDIITKIIDTKLVD